MAAGRIKVWRHGEEEEEGFFGNRGRVSSNGGMRIPVHEYDRKEAKAKVLCYRCFLLYTCGGKEKEKLTSPRFLRNTMGNLGISGTYAIILAERLE